MAAIRYLNLGIGIAMKWLTIKERRSVCLVSGLDILIRMSNWR